MDLCLGAAALLGVATIGWMLCAQITGATIVSFRTGSMSPDLPTGAAAVALPVRADEIAVGDVVTVRRDPESRPVTHRVVSISTVAGQETVRELVLQGDDNAEPDNEPYVVSSAYRVVWGSAWFGDLLRLMQTPAALTVAILGFGVLVTCAFWPAPSEDDETHAGAHDGAAPGEPAAGAEVTT